MTSAAVSERGSIMNLAMQNVSARTDSSDSGFTQVMDKAVNAGKSESMPKDAALRNTGKNNSGTTDRAQTADRPRETEEARRTGDERQQQSQAVTKSGQDAEETAAAADGEISEAGEEAAASQIGLMLAQQAEELVADVAESLSVSVEELTQAMRELEMSLTDILDPSRMKELMMAVTGVDEASLVTDEALYQTMQDLTAMVRGSGEELAKELSMSSEELRAALEKLGETQRNANEDDAKLMTQGDISADRTDERPSVMMHAEMDETAKDRNRQPDNSHMTEHNVQDQALQSGSEIKGPMQAKDFDTDRDARDGEELTEGGEEHTAAQQFINRTNEFIEALTQDMDSPYTNVDAQQIMKQITDFVRMQISSQVSEVELQLHPASLGTLNISVAAKDGIVTAQFTAQNEAVKEILESQTVELKERLEEQGLKIEAVEVTIASHEFERNLEQNADQDADKRGEAKAKRRTTRMLNLEELSEEDAEGLDDEQLIAMDMMRIRGNRLDYLA